MSAADILLRSILNMYLTSYYCLILITDAPGYLNIRSEIPILSIELGHSQKIDHIFNFAGCQAFIIDVKNPVSVFQNIEQQIRWHDDRFNERKYIFMPHSNHDENPFGIFKTEEIEFVSDLLVIAEEKADSTEKQDIRLWNKNDEIYSFWTHKYVGKFNNNKPYMLDKWFSRNESFLSNTNLFPNKIKDQEGRILRAALFSYEPYVIIESKSNGSYLYMGSELVTLLSFSKFHNLTFMPVINEFDYWGEIWDNGSGKGLMGNLIEDNADIGAAALYTWEIAYKFLDLSKPTVRTGITCIVPKPKLAAGWLTPEYAYSPQTWMAVMGMFIVSQLSLYFFDILQISIEGGNKQYEPNKKHGAKCKAQIFGKALISVYKPFVMQNVTDKEITNGRVGKYLMGLVFITTLVLSTTYDSGLASIMTIPRYEKPITTVDELAASGLYWGAQQDAWITSIKDAKEQNLQILVSRFVATTEENLRKYSTTGKFAFSLERLPKDNYAIGSYIEEDVIQNFHLMKEDLYWEYCVLMMRKNSVLLPHVDMFILTVFQAGLISYWQNEAATQYMNQYVQKTVRYLYLHQSQHDFVNLKMVHVQGAFGILVIGNGIASAVFLVELLYCRFFERVALP